jgi:hypothetical protein
LGIACLWRNYLFGLLLLWLPVFAVTQDTSQVDPFRVEAAFLRNFAHYVNWPTHAFDDKQSPWYICVLGNDPFGKVLEKTFKGRTELGRTFEILRSNKLSDLDQCQILYIAYEVSASRRAVLSKLRGRPVLTVSNAPGFLREGGIIRFDVADYVRINVNLDQARAAELAIQTKMLEVSKDIIENGKLRKVR